MLDIIDRHEQVSKKYYEDYVALNPDDIEGNIARKSVRDAEITTLMLLRRDLRDAYQAHRI